MASLRICALLLLVSSALCVDWMTDINQPFTFHCGLQSTLKGIYSQHDFQRGDRRWSFACTHEPKVSLQDCQWTSYVNGFGRGMEFQCPGDKIISGIQSIHNSTVGDRRFQFDCCKPIGLAAHACMYSDLINDARDPINATLPDTLFLKGISSTFYPADKDRTWRFEMCQLDKLASPVVG